MTHPIKPLSHIPVCLHSLIINDDLFSRIVSTGCFFEIDISWDYDHQKLYIGHPYAFYTKVKKTPLPENIEFALAIEHLKQHPEIPVIFDIKDANVIPTLLDLISTLQNTIYCHFFVKEWSLPMPSTVTPEEHWVQEHISIEDIKRFTDQKIYIIGAIRCYSREWILTSPVMLRVFDDAVGIFDSITLYMPNASQQPRELLLKIVDYGYIPLVNIDTLPKNNLEEIGSKCNYIGMTDNIDLASTYL